MTIPIQSKTRLQIREAIGYNLGNMILGTCTAAGTTTTIIDANRLAFGGDQDFVGHEVIMTTGSTANIGLIRKVTAFSAASTLMTIAPGLSAISAQDDGFELWDDFTVTEANAAINQALTDASDDILIEKIDDTTLAKEQNRFQYSIPSGFEALHMVEYVETTRIRETLNDCDTAWDAEANVTATADSSDGLRVEGGNALKLVIADAVSAGDLLVTDAITEVDISESNTVTMWLRSSIAVAAGDFQLLLDNTAACASPIELIDIPALVVDTWTKVSLPLAKSDEDTAIISIGLKCITDLGAMTLWVDDIWAEHSKSREWRMISPTQWEVVQKTTQEIKITSSVIQSIPNGAYFRLSGYQLLTELSTDSSTSEVDPDYIAAHATSRMLMSRSRNRDLDPEDSYRRALYWQGIAQTKRRQAKTHYEMNTRWLR